MYAVIKTGGKQYKVQANDIIEVEKIEAGIGSIVLLDEVLMINQGSDIALGSGLSGFGVAAEIINQKKADKIIVFKKKRRHNYRRKNGHRQLVTVIKITGIGKDLKANILPFKPEENQARVNDLKTAPTKAEKKQAQGSIKAAKPKAEAKPAKAKKETTAKPEAKPATPRKKAAGKTKASAE